MLKPFDVYQFGQSNGGSSITNSQVTTICALQQYHHHFCSLYFFLQNIQSSLTIHGFFTSTLLNISHFFLGSSPLSHFHFSYLF
jgi:hypothetical protein